jgi:hypothetical protein
LIRRRSVRLAIALASTIAVCLLAGCAARTVGYGDPDSGVIREYRMPQGQPLTYEVKNVMEQTMDFQGQSVGTESNMMTLISMTPKGMKGKRHDVTITIDDMSVDIGTPQADLTPDLSGVIGQSFDMSLSVLGVEGNFPEPDVIQYDLGPGGKRSAIAGMKMMFPELAGRRVKIGDTWTTKDGFSEAAETATVHMSFELVNTLAGFETIDGYECAKVTTTFTGTMEGKGTEGPADWTSEGTLSGESTWYFAYKEGIFVADSTKGIGKSTVLAKGPDGEMEIPTLQTFTYDTRLVQE